MWKVGVFTSVAMVALVCGYDPALAQRKKIDDKDKATPATAQEYSQIANAPEMQGKIAYFSPDGSSLVLRLEWQHYDISQMKQNAQKGGNRNDNDARDWAKIRQNQQRAMNEKNPQRRMQLLAKVNQAIQREIAEEIRENMGKGGKPNFKIVTERKDFELPLAEKVIYRKLVLPVQFDETGNLKAFTKEEKEALRGTDKSLPGYKASPEEFTSGAIVTLKLVPPSKTKNADNAGSASKPSVRMVIMTQAPPGGIESAAPSKKPGKK